MGAGSAADANHGGSLVMAGHGWSYSFRSTTALDTKARARPAAGDREGPPVSRVSGSCVWRNAGDQCVAARACLCFYGPSKAYLILADFLVPASDWCRLMAARDSLDASAAHSCP